MLVLLVIIETDSPLNLFHGSQLETDGETFFLELPKLHFLFRVSNLLFFLPRQIPIKTHGFPRLRKGGGPDRVTPVIPTSLFRFTTEDFHFSAS